MKIITVFGSQSDEPTYRHIASVLRKKGHEVITRVCSAHRTPERLPLVLAMKPDLIIAGAGLAAHLPGVDAAHTITPVVGVPVASNYGGIDSWLSIVQMPPGIPVLACSVDAEVAAQQIAGILEPFDHIKSECKDQKLADKAKRITEELKVPMQGKRPLTISVGKQKQQAICVPVRENAVDKDAVAIFNNYHPYLCVGLGRVDNAVIMAAHLIAQFAKNKTLADNIAQMRKRNALKIIKADEEAQKWTQN